MYFVVISFAFILKLNSMVKLGGLMKTAIVTEVKYDREIYSLKQGGGYGLIHIKLLKIVQT